MPLTKFPRAGILGQLGATFPPVQCPRKCRYYFPIGTCTLLREALKIKAEHYLNEVFRAKLVWSMYILRTARLVFCVIYKFESRISDLKD